MLQPQLLVVRLLQRARGLLGLHLRRRPRRRALSRHLPHRCRPLRRARHRQEPALLPRLDAGQRAHALLVQRLVVGVHVAAQRPPERPGQLPRIPLTLVRQHHHRHPLPTQRRHLLHRPRAQPARRLLQQFRRHHHALRDARALQRAQVSHRSALLQGLGAGADDREVHERQGDVQEHCTGHQRERDHIGPVQRQVGDGQHQRRHRNLPHHHRHGQHRVHGTHVQ
mmetsp:Transcript_30179/g.98643  ORF Transcript_30179/g.98643 Transcript_30179/m.98643 type:complete len:225 (-) Transcript_30179:144-818(-)